MSTRCGFNTAKGKPCKNHTKHGQFCGIHAKMIGGADSAFESARDAFESARDPFESAKDPFESTRESFGDLNSFQSTRDVKSVKASKKDSFRSTREAESVKSAKSAKSVKSAMATEDPFASTKSVKPKKAKQSLKLGKYDSLPTLESKNYKMGQKLGKGQYGSVYKAVAPDGSTVAIKYIDPMESNEQDLAQEVGLLTELSKDNCHKNIVCYYGLYKTTVEGKPTLAIVMEFIDGKEIDKTYKDLKKPLNKELAGHLVEGLLKGLKIMHDQHIYHEDIKEANIMVMKKTNDPIYVDFGLGCKAEKEKGPYSCDRGLGGSPYYMSQGKTKCASQRVCSEDDMRYTDIWSLGMVLLSVLSGKELPDDDDDEVRYKLINDYLRKNGDNLYPLDKGINNVIKLALSNDTSVTADDLIKIYVK